MVLRSGPEAFGYTFVKPTNDDDDEQPAASASAPEEQHTDDIETGVDVAPGSAAAAGGGDGGDGLISCATDDQQVEVKDISSLSKNKENDDVQTKQAAAKKDAKEKQDKKKPFIYIPTPSSSKSKGKNNSNDDDAAAAAAAAKETFTCLSFMGACCCCFTILLLVAGSILFATEWYLNSVNPEEDETATRMSLAAVICMILGGGTCLFACCTCIMSCCCTMSSLAVGGGGESGGPWEDAHKEVRVALKRQNDRYSKAEELLDSIHFNAIKDVKGINEAEKKEWRQKKEDEKKKKNELEAQVKKDLEAGLRVKDIRRNYRPCAFVIRFHGDVMLHNAAELLRKQVSIVVNCARPGLDQAIIVITSPGGAVSSYGLAASQLIRLRKAGIKLVACVDTVAASGGYMMAAVADVIYAAPFSVIGSIGVVTQIPNVQRFLNKHDIDAYLFTAGKHKRTIDIIGDVTDENKAKLQEELDEIHRAFKDHIALARPKVRETIEDIATGEHWLAVHAKEKGLVDDILTSDEYLESIAKENEIIELVEKKKKSSPLISGLLGPGGGLSATAQSIKDFLVNSFFGTTAATTSTIGQQPTTPMAIA